MTTNILVPITIDYGLLPDTLTGEGDALLPVLEAAWNSVREALRDFAQSPDFKVQMELAFGQGVNVSNLQEAWARGEVEFPTIEIRPAAELNGAGGAFAQATNRIYLSAEFLSQNADNPDSITAVLLEEFGHSVDARLNQQDAAGDEGAIFSALVRGEGLSDSQLQQLKAEDDLAVVSLDGQEMAIEMSFGTTGMIQFGTSDWDASNGISTDSSGNIYVIVWTFGSLPGYTNQGSIDAVIAKYDPSGDQVWVKQFGTSYDDNPYGISTDSGGNIYVTGGMFVSSYDGFIAKYDPSGNQVWVKQFGTSYDADSLSGISTDSAGNVYVSGYTSGSLPGNTNLGGKGAVIAKYDPSGNQVWVKQFGVSIGDATSGISTDSAGNVYVSGYTIGSLPGNTNLGGNDAFIAKYDASGNQVWLKQFGTSSSDEPTGISTDSGGNVYVSGWTVGSLSGNANLGGYDAFIAKESRSNKFPFCTY